MGSPETHPHETNAIVTWPVNQLRVAKGLPPLDVFAVRVISADSTALAPGAGMASKLSSSGIRTHLRRQAEGVPPQGALSR